MFFILENKKLFEKKQFSKQDNNKKGKTSKFIHFFKKMKKYMI